MEALAAGGLDEALETLPQQVLAHVDGALHDRVPGHAVPGIEVEDEPVGLVRVGERRAPGVDLEHACLDQREEAREVMDRHRVVLTG
jgi:hypothetical protein